MGDVEDCQADKNSELLCCKFCPSKILRSGLGTKTSHEFQLPVMDRSAKLSSTETGRPTELIASAWMVPDMFQFENIGFSKDVGTLKYLICADCESGPIGWHDKGTGKSFVAMDRVNTAPE